MEEAEEVICLDSSSSEGEEKTGMWVNQKEMGVGTTDYEQKRPSRPQINSTIKRSPPSEIRMEKLKSLLSKAKRQKGKKDDNINISISKSAMKLSKNMNISISMVAGDRSERRSQDHRGHKNTENSVICVEDSEGSDTGDRAEPVPTGRRKRPSWSKSDVSVGSDKPLKILEKHTSKGEQDTHKSTNGKIEPRSRPLSSASSKSSKFSKEKKRKRHCSSSSSSSSSTYSECSSASVGKMVADKCPKLIHRNESTSESVAKKLKRKSEMAKETTSERYLKQMKLEKLITERELKYAQQTGKKKESPPATYVNDTGRKSTSELFLENLENLKNLRDYSPKPTRCSSEETSDQLFDRLLNEGGRRSRSGPPLHSDTAASSDCPSGTDDRRPQTPVVRVKDRVDAFLKSCQGILPSKEFPPVFKKISKYMNNIAPSHLNSNSLSKFLYKKIAVLANDEEHVFIHIKSVLDEMKKYKMEAKGDTSEVSDFPGTPRLKTGASAVSLITEPKDNSQKYPFKILEKTKDDYFSEHENSTDDVNDKLEKIIKKPPAKLWSNVIGFRCTSDAESGSDAFDHSERRIVANPSLDSDGVEEHMKVVAYSDNSDKLKDEDVSSPTDTSMTPKVPDFQKEKHRVGLTTIEKIFGKPITKVSKFSKFSSDNADSEVKKSYVSEKDTEEDLDKDCERRTETLDSDNSSNDSRTGGLMSSLNLKRTNSDVYPSGRKRVTLTTISSNSRAKCLSSSPPRTDIEARVEVSKSAEHECFNKFLVNEDDNGNVDACDEVLDSQYKERSEKKKKASERHLKKLEKALRKCGKKIQDLEEEPIDWDKDEDSNFILAAKLKNRYMAIHKKIAEYKKQSFSLDRRSDKKFSFTDSKYPEIGKKIEKFVNRTNEFPDFADIKKEVEDVNLKKRLLLTETQMHTEAERIFVTVGKKLKRRRFDDDAAVMYSYLDDDDPGDPASKDVELDLKLDALGKIAKKKIDTVFQEFVEKQVNKVKTEEEDSDEPIDDELGYEKHCSLSTNEEIPHSAENCETSEGEELGSEVSDDENVDFEDDVDVLDDDEKKGPMIDEDSQSSALHLSTGSDVDDLLESGSELEED